MNFERLIVFSTLLIFFIGLSLVYSKNIEQEAKFSSTYTRAFCSGQTCRDFLVACSGGEIVSLTPISGFVAFGSEWVDLREKKELC